MESALIVARTQKSADFFTQLLHAASIHQVTASQSCAQARRLLLERDFDLLIINAPLQDETGESLARHAAAGGTAQAILVVRDEFYEAVAAACEGDGVLTIARPVSRTVFWSALMLAKAAQSRLKTMQAENARLTRKIEEIRMVDRAKCLLISRLRMSEQEAHRYIEKQAMDLRRSKREVAQGIIGAYEE